jgi:hypothetical protein
MHRKAFSIPNVLTIHEKALDFCLCGYLNVLQVWGVLIQRSRQVSNSRLHAMIQESDRQGGVAWVWGFQGNLLQVSQLS